MHAYRYTHSQSMLQNRELRVIWARRIQCPRPCVIRGAESTGCLEKDEAFPGSV